MGKLPSHLLPARASTLLAGNATRPTLSPAHMTTETVSRTGGSSSSSSQQVRHATLIHRPRRPYTFTQMVQLSDGSTYTVRTTSPHAIYRSAKDTRNNARWQPSDSSLRNVEVDEAGKLAAFRERFGRGWDAAKKEDPRAAAAADGGAANQAAAAAAAAPEEDFLDLTDLIGGYATAAGMDTGATGMNAKEAAKAEKAGKKKGKK
ncbi:hypothetical protein PgNI_05812 [Pyricularia grisea]|uniref:Ribosomal protein bL31m N-terminal domain-containing protein n=1 Tax=Pyricularia grisea TaxID=148305 RepID=A0A6P8B5Y0_PYRGI|nr:hypothetical protein PgNI_05812 [Pyricularia grisea]TLD10655.1 hypothetical protein PgNI_05812 [Pyricularia grisea]